MFLQRLCGRGSTAILVSSLLFLPTQPARAQAKDAFVEAVADFSQATAGNVGDEGPTLKAALDAMAAGLAQWDGAVSRVEAGFTAAITGAPPREAAQMRATIGVTYLERGRLAEALTHLDAAASSPEMPASVHLLRGLGHARRGRHAAAAEAFGRARRAAPTSATAAYLFLRATPDAKPSAERTAALRTLSSAVAAVASGVSRPDVAVPVFDAIGDGSVDTPLFPLSAYASGVELFRQARYAEALASWRAAVAADPLATNAALATSEARAASAALAAGDTRSAVDGFLSVPGRATSSEVQRLLGLAYSTLGDHGKSLEHLRAASRLNPKDERARLSIVDVLVASGDRAAARAALIDTLKAFPRSGQAQWRLGRLSRDLGDEAAALQAYEAAARLTPLAGASALHAAIGALRHNAFDLEAAAAAYERRVDLTPHASAAHLDLGAVYRAQDRLEDAWVEFAAAAMVEPTNARALAALGQVQADMSDDDEAVVMLQAAVRLDPEQVEARYALSRALLRAGRPDDARRELEAYERLQKAAMEAQRRQFEANSRAIEKALREGRPTGTAR
jgi:tetratricopeptide (TPR) repeat protein